MPDSTAPGQGHMRIGACFIASAATFMKQELPTLMSERKPGNDKRVECTVSGSDASFIMSIVVI